jgi:hypothetical protein
MTTFTDQIIGVGSSPTPTDAMLRGGTLQKKGERRLVNGKAVSQAIVDSAKARINLVEAATGVWMFQSRPKRRRKLLSPSSSQC